MSYMETSTVEREIEDWRAMGLSWDYIRSELGDLVNEMESDEAATKEEAKQAEIDYPLGPETSVTVRSIRFDGLPRSHEVMGYAVLFPGYEEFSLVVHPQVISDGKTNNDLFKITEPRTGKSCGASGTTPHLAIKALVTSTISTPEKIREAIRRELKSELPEVCRDTIQ